MKGLLVAGAGVLIVGLLAIGFGIQDKEFEVGKTLILAGVATACTGNLPTLVSPESITASAPSITAFATSDASARVGRECVIIDSGNFDTGRAP